MTAFQSRLSKNWLTPFTDETLIRLAQSGRKRVLVVPASFVADCLETTEEIGHEYRELFMANGGIQYTMSPSLNSNPAWRKAIVELMSQEDSGN